MEKFDFTSKQGLQKIFDVVSSSSAINNPTFMLAKYVIDKITDLTKSWEVQRDAIERLIQKGHEDGADEMEIVINNKRGFKFNAPIEGTVIDTLMGADEKMHIRVKYK